MTTRKTSDPLKPGRKTSEGLYTAVAGAVTSTVALLTALGVLKPDSVPAAAEARWAMISTAVLGGAYAGGRSLLKAAQARHGGVTAAEIEGIVADAVKAAFPAALDGMTADYEMRLSDADHTKLAEKIVAGLGAGKAVPQRVVVDHPAPTLVAPDVPQGGHSDHTGVSADHAHVEGPTG